MLSLQMRFQRTRPLQQPQTNPLNYIFLPLGFSIEEKRPFLFFLIFFIILSFSHSFCLQFCSQSSVSRISTSQSSLLLFFHSLFCFVNALSPCLVFNHSAQNTFFATSRILAPNCARNYKIPSEFSRTKIKKAEIKKLLKKTIAPGSIVC
ncbi:MAG: hypothetical protein J3R72DRAFT_15781 [Linnemannia gamsii]|nr:MAG: hypothetical protein J3R72DRAFT_15781 [Linnemannia gamsii]